MGSRATVTDLQPPTTENVLAAVLKRRSEHREVHAALVTCCSAAWNGVETRLLSLCRERVAQMLGCPSETTVAASAEQRLLASDIGDLGSWRQSTRFDDRERVCLAFTEQFVFDVASLDDSTVHRVSEALGHEGLLAFVSALLVVEQRIRLRLVWEQLGLHDQLRLDEQTTKQESAQ
jgi:alkylhydroperoxidase family enzyme